MKILPVNLFNIHARKTENNQYNYSRNNLSVKTQPLYDTVNFTGSSPMSIKEFKKLGKYMTCLYSGDKMISSDQLTKMKKRGFFKGPISDVVMKLKPYKDKYLEPIEKEVFERIEEAAKETPDIDLPQLFKNWYKTTRSNFRRIQKPKFDAIKTLGAELPQEYIQPFFKFMETIDKKLYDQPIKQEFSLKEFSYKITKITEKMSDGNLKNRMQKLLDLLQNENLNHGNRPLSSTFVKQVFDFKNVKAPGRKSVFYEKNYQKYETDKDAVRIAIIEKMRKTAEMKGYKKLEKLCAENIGMIEGIPVHVAFSNKAFVYDLDKLLENMPDKALKQKMLDIAMNLPTSSRSADALILKFRDADPDIIGDRLFNPGMVSVEHLKAKSEGGPNTLSNVALAKKQINSDRQSKPLWQVLENYPLKNQQKYVNNLAKLVARGKMRYEDALSQVQTIEREGHIILDKSKIKKIENPLVEKLKEKFTVIS